MKKFRRVKYIPESKDLNKNIQLIESFLKIKDYNKCFDVIEFLVDNYPQLSVELLSNAYEIYKEITPRDRYTLYQSRIYDFKIEDNAKVLDIGSGHNPFPLATHLADLALSDDNLGRAGVPFKKLEGKPVYEFNVEEIPFEDKYFDFVYCSHVLEHTDSPERACKELIRVAKRGYIETPTKSKDLWLNTGKISNHKWFVEKYYDHLIFTEYDETGIEGFNTDILMNMHVAPQSQREKAFSALIYLKPEIVNTMMAWENSFDYEIRRKKQNLLIGVKEKKSKEKIRKSDTLKFFQVHTFYERYLELFYSNEQNKVGSFQENINRLLDDGFSGNHLFPRYMNKLGYDSFFTVGNDPVVQQKWLMENQIKLNNTENWVHDVVKLQIEKFKPDILYITNPITYDAKFIEKINYRPKLIIGWRAADIPEQTSFVGFDLILSGINGILDFAKKIGAKKTKYFFPGFPIEILDNLSKRDNLNDIVFVGSWTNDQHKERNKLLHLIAKYSIENNLKTKFFLSGEIESIPEEVKMLNFGQKFGLSMYEELINSKITFDGQGKIRSLEDKNDISGGETINMRIFEATGTGSLLITKNSQNIKNFFSPGEEIVVYEDESELIEKIKFYLGNEEQRKKIADQGKKKCIENYSMESRAEELDKIILENLRDKEIEQSNIFNPSREMEEIQDLLNNKKIDEAFQRVIELKAKKIKFENLDLFRAFCFIYKNDLSSARNALLEELVNFPSNQIAKETLNNLPDQFLVNSNDKEFNEILEKIKPFTMLSIERLFSLYENAKYICNKDIPGDFVECGVARGGSSILLANVIKKYSKRKRKIYSCDTFEGMPEPSGEDKTYGTEANLSGWGEGTCSGSMENLLNLAEKWDLVDIIVPIKGLFQDTLPDLSNKIESISFLHMDGDWYDSTKSILINLFESVDKNGFIQIDDYGFWEGCRKAVDEFLRLNGFRVELKKIDSTGVCFYKNTIKKNEKVLLNLGCGNKIRDGWINIDVNSHNEKVVKADLSDSIPFDDNFADAIYASHVLEHFSKQKAKDFIKECYRVLKNNGVLRIVVPDLETIVKLYLENLQAALNGDKTAEKKYEWIMLELFDQMTREFSGGEMIKYLAQSEIPAKDFVISRFGEEGKNIIENAQKGLINIKDKLNITEKVEFLESGERHKWMYDRFSLKKLLIEVGFKEVILTDAFKSRIENFSNYFLDINEKNEVRKPDSLFMEAIK